jgi:hypothetical protein
VENPSLDDEGILILVKRRGKEYFAEAGLTIDAVTGSLFQRPTGQLAPKVWPAKSHDPGRP